MKFKRIIVSLLAVEAALVLSGCGGSSTAPSVTPSSSSPKLATFTGSSRSTGHGSSSGGAYSVSQPSSSSTQDNSGTSYPVSQCLDELSRGAEIRQDQLIDRLVAYKGKRKIEGYRNGRKVFESKMSLGKNGDKGNKIQAGDYRTPEGTYTIVRKKCDPRLYRSLMISYPNKEDIARAKARGVNPGGYITIHGQPKWNADGHGDSYTLAHDWTEGCMAVPNKKMKQLWEGVRNGVPITIHP